MTKQEYYDLLIASCYDGTFPSGAMEECIFEPTGKRFNCKYRVPGSNKKCAFGLLIPDDKYNDEFEKKGCDATAVREAAIVVEGFKSATKAGYNRSDYRKVQICHDDAAQTHPDDIVKFREHFIARINSLACFDDVVKVDPPVSVGPN